MSMEELFKQFITQNPQLLPFQKAGRKVGIPNKQKEIEVTPEEMNDVVLNSRQIKDIAHKQRKPRKEQTEEQKNLMLDNLAKGREKAKANREEKKIKPVEKPVEVKQTITVVVPKVKHRKPKKVVISDDEDIELETETETDVETKIIKKRVDRRQKIVDKITQQIEAIKPVAINPFDRLVMSRM